MQAATVLKEHKIVSQGVNARGPWAVTIFTDQNNQQFKTLDNQIAAQGVQLLEKPVTIEYEPEIRPGREQYPPDLVIKNLVMAAGAVPEANGAVFVPATDVGETLKTTTPYEDKQAVINRSAGLARAIEMRTADGLKPSDDLAGLFEDALEIASFIETGIVPGSSS